MAKGTIIQLCFSSKGFNFGSRHIESLLLLYNTVFIPKLIFSCEAWSDLTTKDYDTLQAFQLNFMRRIPEVSRRTPIAATDLELGIWPMKYETHKRRLIFFKRILERNSIDHCLQVYEEMLGFKDKPKLGQ